MAALTLRAPAKLNLFLHITGKREDGYHELESLVVFTDLTDSLSISEGNGLGLTVSGEFKPATGALENNLVLQAARALQAATNTSHGAHIALSKNIPVGAGLGGGSADAAATLNGLNQFWELNLTPQELHEIAVPLGADVPMCLATKPSWVQGIGEILTPLQNPLMPLAAVLVYPRVQLLTKDVYHAFNMPTGATPGWNSNADFLEALARTRNDLQPPAITITPLVAEVLLALETLQPAPILVRMTGSGACCFALYNSHVKAAQAASQIAKDYPDWWVRAVNIAR